MSKDKTPLPLLHRNDEGEWKDFIGFVKRFYPYMNKVGPHEFEVTVSMDVFVDPQQEGKENLEPTIVTHQLVEDKEENKAWNMLIPLHQRAGDQKAFLKRINEMKGSHCRLQTIGPHDCVFLPARRVVAEKSTTRGCGGCQRLRDRD
jgi:hypothetical protein